MRRKWFIWLGNVAKTASKWFEWIENIPEFDESFMKSYNEEIHEQYFLKVAANNLHNDLTFPLEIMEIEKVKKIIDNLHDKTEYIIHIRNLKQVSNHGLILNKVHRVIKVNQKDLLQLYIYMSKELRKKTKQWL